MARPRSEKVLEVKRQLLERLSDPTRKPGTRFSSARAVSASYGISYQTAHRLLVELQAEGRIVRRPASGTFGAGRARQMIGVQICFSERARRKGSFGERLLSELRERLLRDGVAVKVSFDSGSPLRLNHDRLPVLWESPLGLHECLAGRRMALLLNDRPPPGIDSMHIDSVGVDDYAGGALAAEVLMQRVASRAKLLVIAGPEDDRRSNARVDGFRSKAGSRVSVISAGGWYFNDGIRVANQVLASAARGIFCCNDRLAQAAMAISESSANRRPSVVGFDDAPIAAELKLTTIGIPWVELIRAASDVVRRRLRGDPSSASHEVMTPQVKLREQLDCG